MQYTKQIWIALWGFWETILSPWACCRSWMTFGIFIFSDCALALLFGGKVRVNPAHPKQIGSIDPQCCVTDVVRGKCPFLMSAHLSLCCFTVPNWLWMLDCCSWVSANSLSGWYDVFEATFEWPVHITHHFFESFRCVWKCKKPLWSILHELSWVDFRRIQW